RKSAKAIVAVVACWPRAESPAGELAGRAARPCGAAPGHGMSPVIRVVPEWLSLSRLGAGRQPAGLSKTWGRGGAARSLEHAVLLRNQQALGANLKHVRRPQDAGTRLLFHRHVGVANTHDLVGPAHQTQATRAQQRRPEAHHQPQWMSPKPMPSRR